MKKKNKKQSVVAFCMGVYLYLGRNSVTIERFGGRVTAPMKRTTFG